MISVLITTDLHQHPAKWRTLADAIVKGRPTFVLIAGDILPKYNGFEEQAQFFPWLRECLTGIRDQTGARVILYLSNDDAHYLEAQVDDLQADNLCVNLNQKVHREAGLVFCGMNKVRDYPFGYKHYCVPDGDWITDPVQFCPQGVTFDDQGNQVTIPDLRKYLLANPTLLAHLEDLKSQLQPAEMAQSIWLVHQPPSGLGMDICARGPQVGSPALLKFIRDNQPLLGCSGHIHESPHQPGGHWYARVGTTTWLQPGQLTDRLHYVTVDITDDLTVTNLRHSIFGATSAR
jgi:Icc-related predicted phosphoesterase